MTHRIKLTLLGFAALAGVLAAAAPADACGGFFCSQVQPVNQAAERIIFANNGDGTQTAVIEIMYEGPSEHFSWLLPISSVPQDGQIKVASDLAFQRLQAATNPQYTLNTTIEGRCKASHDAGNPGVVLTGGGTGGNSGGPPSPDAGVTVEATGVVGAFMWTVISLDPKLSDPADVAVQWLGDNGYDVPSGAPELLGPYLSDGLYLLALRLTKGADVGSIRPVVLTYEATRPMIPVKLTAVAANDDMGVMTWVLGDSRAVPQNYYALELNEARINWFNAASNYNDVVSAAADDAGGQGFVTELSGPTSALANVVWSQSDESQWQSFKSGVSTSFEQLFNGAYATYGQYDGFWDAVQAAVTLPDGVAFADFKLCPSCYSAQLAFEPSALMSELENQVIEPIRGVQTLIDAHPQITRLYTTMSADEMNLDPIFTFNPDLADSSNLHTANRVIECNPGIDQSEATWRIEFPQGGVLRGTSSDVGTWPTAVGTQPANRVILRQGETGDGKVIEDDSADIVSALDAYNQTVPHPPAAADGTGAGGSASSGDEGCSLSPRSAPGAGFAGLFGLLLVARLRRRHR